MNERERLIAILEKAPKSLQYEDLPDYLLENGVVVLPCKIGDDVYEITKYCFDCSCFKEECDDIYFCERESGGYLFEVDWDKSCRYKISKTPFNYSLITDIGKSVFLTKEEAEQALKGGAANEAN